MDLNQIVKSLLTEIGKFKPSHGDVDAKLLFDDNTKQYAIYYIGWDGEKRIYGQIAHLEVKENKIWIHYDGTAQGIALLLEKKGIPKEQIVLGFMDELHRKLSGYAVA